MIIDKTIKMKWVSTNKEKFINKGYIFTKMYIEFDLNIDDLDYGSEKKILVKCDICGKEKMLQYRKYIKNVNRGGYYTCSQICSHDKTKQTCLEKYGVEFYMKTDEYKERYKNTCLEKYGVENISQSEDIKDKKRKTCLSNYGVEYPGQSIELKEKSKKTCLEKYGVEYPWLNKEIKDKVYNTMLNRYGVKIPSKNTEIMNKIIKTQIEKYGELWKNHIPRYNPKSIIYLDMISEELNIIIKHALNGGEEKFGKYWVDGYIKEHNICIEWDEKEHKNNRQNDIMREDYIKNKYKCSFIRIDEIEFLKNIEQSILNIINEINNIIKLLDILKL
ncbi:hypothetical protein M0Q50_04485 [bacterium]|jgi:hypothetical protein|nr:hypothetical protein [bacterium]